MNELQKTRQEYDPALFSGTAQYYSQYRLGYPDELYTEILKHVRADSPRLLDIGCGPGTIAVALARRCKHVSAVDPDPDMLIEAKRIAIASKLQNITFIENTAEALDIAELSPFDLVTFGSSIHWMNCNEFMTPLCTNLNSGGE